MRVGPSSVRARTIPRAYPKGIAGFRRYVELIDLKPEIVDAPDAIDVSDLRGEIRYENVSFGFRASRCPERPCEPAQRSAGRHAPCWSKSSGR